MPLQAIVPKVRFRNPNPNVARDLFRWKGAVVARMGTYPTQQGHVDYVRTGTYGRNWRFSIKKGEVVSGER